MILLAVVVFGCNRNGGNHGQPDHPNIIVLLVDTLRADFVGAYGGQYPTPVMDLLANQGVLFEKTYAPSSWTVPSVASVFLGMYPQRHGLNEGIALKGKVSLQQTMPAEYVTIAETLKAAGYTTFCATSNAHIAENYGYNAGFDHFQMFPFSNGDMLEEQVRQWKSDLEKASKTTGYFLFLHWVDPHHPYDPRDPYISQIAPDYMTNIGKLLQENPDRLLTMGYFRDFPDKLDLLKKLYASEIAWTDASLGRTLKMLPGLADSLLVFTSDHGEAFAEHQSMLHGIDLYQETVHVPLVIRLPGNQGAGTRITTPVTLVDLAPTLTAFAKAKPNPEHQGLNLLPLIAGEKTPKRELFAHLDKLSTFRWDAVFDRDLKFLEHKPTRLELARANKEGKTLTPKLFLYDLSADPGEEKNLVEKESENLTRLRAMLDEEMAKPPLQKPVTEGFTITDEEIEKFKGMSYLN